MTVLVQNGPELSASHRDVPLKMSVVRVLAFDPDWQAMIVGQNVTTGEWELPGGQLNVGEGPKEAIKRELKEEIGMRSLILTPPVKFEEREFYKDGVLRHYIGNVMVGTVLNGFLGQPHPQPGELSDAMWLRLDDAPRAIASKKMTFRKGSFDALMAAHSGVDDMKGIRVSRQVRALAGVIKLHESLTYAKGEVDMLVA